MEENIEKLQNFVDLQTSLLEELQNLHLVIPYISHPPPPFFLLHLYPTQSLIFPPASDPLAMWAR